MNTDRGIFEKRDCGKFGKRLIAIWSQRSVVETRQPVGQVPATGSSYFTIYLRRNIMDQILRLLVILVNEKFKNNHEQKIIHDKFVQLFQTFS